MNSESWIALNQHSHLHFISRKQIIFFIKKYILSIVRSALKEKDLLDTIFIGLKISQGIWPCPFWNIMKEEWCSRDPLLMKYPFPLLLKKKDILNGILTSMKISQGIWGYPYILYCFGCWFQLSLDIFSRRFLYWKTVQNIHSKYTNFRCL